VSTEAGNCRPRINPAQLRGTIVCIAVQHQLALFAEHRLLLAQILKFSLNQVSFDA